MNPSSDQPDGSNDSLRERLERSLSGSYRIERELGGGGMARVFLADERALGRQVVVKVLAPELSHGLSAERFEREIRLLARLQHPNIVPVLAAGVAGDMPYYTMPFIQGESLRKRLARLGARERLPLGEALDVLRDVARALAYAHRLGVVHRDIKPENVLLGDDAAVVADFGVAKAVAAARTQEGGAEAFTLTRGGVALGTPAYMSPEQAAGDPDVDHRADVYAWGVLAYEILAGSHPFAERRTIQTLLAAHLTEQPGSLEEVASGTPAGVSALVMRCLAKSPAARPASAREIVETLSSVSAEKSVPARTIPGKAVRKLRTPTAQVAAGLALLVVFASGAAIMYMNRDGRTATPPVHTSPAYDLYLRGKVRVNAENRESNDAAIAVLREAVSKDPLFAPAWAELARAYQLKEFYFAADSERKLLREDAKVALEQALALDDSLPEAYLVRGLLLWTPAERFPHEQAVSAYRQALALNPKLDEARGQLGLVLIHVGLLDEAQSELAAALNINQANLLARFRLGVIDLYRGEYERAYSKFKSTTLNGNPSLWYSHAAAALFRLGRESEAKALLDEYLHENPKDEGGAGTSVRAMMLAKAGRRGDAEGAIAKAMEIGKNFGHFHHTEVNVASSWALLGENEKAIELLERAADNGFPCYPLFEKDSFLDGLRKEPRFIALMTNLAQKWNERKRTLGSPG